MLSDGVVQRGIAGFSVGLGVGISFDDLVVTPVAGGANTRVGIAGWGDAVLLVGVAVDAMFGTNVLF